MDGFESAANGNRTRDEHAYSHGMSVQGKRPSVVCDSSSARSITTVPEEVDQSSHHDAMLLASFANIASKASVAHPQSITTASSCTHQEVTPRFPSLPDASGSEKHHDVNVMAKGPKMATPINSVSGPIPGSKNDIDIGHTRPRKISYSIAEIANHPMASSLSPRSQSRHEFERPMMPPSAPTCSPRKSPPPCVSFIHPKSSSSLPIKPLAPNTTSPKPKHHAHQQKARDYQIILRKKFSWKHYPPLEAFLIANRGEYLRHSALNYTSQQKRFNNMLTEQMIQLASQHGLVFDQEEFSFVTIRDRIRCYYKSYVQSLKKKGIICGYAAKKAGLHSFDGHGGYGHGHQEHGQH